jgi:hypothetical protein
MNKNLEEQKSTAAEQATENAGADRKEGQAPAAAAEKTAAAPKPKAKPAAKKAAKKPAKKPAPKPKAKPAAKKAAKKPASKKAAAKPKGKPAAKKEKQQGIGAFCESLLKQKKSTDEILAAVRSKFPDAKTSPASVAWYRNKMREEGTLPKT